MNTRRSSWLNSEKRILSIVGLGVGIEELNLRFWIDGFGSVLRECGLGQVLVKLIGK